jgi:phage baseplate assembly protein W
MSVRDIDLDPDKAFGIGFPLNYDKNTYGFFKRNYKYYEQIQDNIRTLLLTQIGERVGNPEYGSRLREIVFEQNVPEIIKPQINEAIKEALDKFLPFVSLEETILRADGNTLNAVCRFSTEFNDQVILALNIGPLPGGVPDDIGTAGAGAGY